MRGSTDDTTGDDCDVTRQLVSAEADDSLDADETERLSRHLAGCVDCSAYRDRVAALTRSTRMRPASADPSFVDAVMRRAQPARLGRGGWLRPALAWCGVVIAVQSLDPLLFGSVDGAPTHVARHIGASTLALAVGLLYVAWRPHRAPGLLPLVGALFATMLTGAFLDVASGDRSALSEAAHVSEMVGLVLVWLIAGSPGWDRVESLFRRDRRAAVPSTS